MSTTPDEPTAPSEVAPCSASAPARTDPASLLTSPPMSTTPPTPSGDREAQTVAPGRRRRLLVTITVLTVVVLLVDQLSKVWAERSLVPGERVPLVGDLLGLTLIYNPGAALSIATGMTWVLTLVATVVVVVVVRASRRIGSRGWAIALGLLLGGALGNLVDRFFREPGFARGHVVDFIAYGELFVGNVADIAIVGAAALIVMLALRGIGLDGSREGEAASKPAGVTDEGADVTDEGSGAAADAVQGAAPSTAPGAPGDDAGSHRA